MEYLKTITGLFNRPHHWLGISVFVVTLFILGSAISVSAQTGYSLQSESTSFTNNTATINWTAPADRLTRSGWVGIYKPGASDRQYVRWTYINQSANSGTATFNNLQSGTYEARFFSGNGYDRLTTSASFTVGSQVSNPNPNPNPIPNPNPNPDPGGAYELTLSANSITSGDSVTVTFATPTNSNRNRDWIGLYRLGASNQAYESWRYVGSGASGSLTFSISGAGQYEFRYFKNNGYTLVAVSPLLTVLGVVAQCPISNLNAITNYPPVNGPIVAFGDSLTAGVGASAGQDYVSQLGRLSGVPVINAGVPGDTTRTALERLESDVLSRNPSTVIVWLGGNDVLIQYYDRVVRGLESPTLINLINATLNRLGSKVTNSPVIPENETFANLETVIRAIQAEGAVAILVGFSGEPFNSGLESRFAAVANQTGAIYVPNVLSGIIGRPDRMSDIIHPNNAGYTIVTNRIYQRLLCVL